MPFQRAAEQLLKNNPAIEAVLRCSQDGLPLAVHAHEEGTAEEIISIAAGLFAAARRSGLLTCQKRQLFIQADHGGLYVQLEPDQSQLIVLTRGFLSEQEIISAIDHVGLTYTDATAA